MLTLHGKRSGKFWFANRGFRGKVDSGLTFAVEWHLPLPRKARGLFKGSGSVYSNPSISCVI